jgi:hypothetical protein
MTEPWVSVEDIARRLGLAEDSVYGRAPTSPEGENP